MSDQNKITNLDDLSNELKAIAILLLKAKGVDYDVLAEQDKPLKEKEILEIFFGFVEDVLDQNKNTELAQEWENYKQNGFDSTIYNSSKYLKKAMDEITSQFIKI